MRLEQPCQSAEDLGTHFIERSLYRVFAGSFLIGDGETPTERGGLVLRHKPPGRVAFCQGFCRLTEFLQKGTCDAAALFANFVKWHSLKVTDVQDEILGFEVCNVGQ